MLTRQSTYLDRNSSFSLIKVYAYQKKYILDRNSSFSLIKVYADSKKYILVRNSSFSLIKVYANSTKYILARNSTFQLIKVYAYSTKYILVRNSSFSLDKEYRICLMNQDYQFIFLTGNRIRKGIIKTTFLNQFLNSETYGKEKLNIFPREGSHHVNLMLN